MEAEVRLERAVAVASECTRLGMRLCTYRRTNRFMKKDSERSQTSPGAQSYPGGRSPLARQAAARVLQAAANRRALNAQTLAQQTPATSVARIMGGTAVTSRPSLIVASRSGS